MGWGEESVWTVGGGGCKLPPAPEMAADAVGTHPTGMHTRLLSTLQNISRVKYTSSNSKYMQFCATTFVINSDKYSFIFLCKNILGLFKVSVDVEYDRKLSIMSTREFW